MGAGKRSTTPKGGTVEDNGRFSGKRKKRFFFLETGSCKNFQKGGQNL